jgi:hypothetical protein
VVVDFSEEPAWIVTAVEYNEYGAVLGLELMGVQAPDEGDRHYAEKYAPC